MNTYKRKWLEVSAGHTSIPQFDDSRSHSADNIINYRMAATTTNQIYNTEWQQYDAVAGMVVLNMPLQLRSCYLLLPDSLSIRQITCTTNFKGVASKLIKL